jgi:hypothetical protein
MASQMEKDRFRSFAERYVIERASTLPNEDHEGLNLAWQAVQQATRIYQLIATKAENLHVPEAPEDLADRCIPGKPLAGLGKPLPTAPSLLQRVLGKGKTP